MLTPWALLTATAGLIAFHIGLFTLIGRERKSPYIINEIFLVFLISLFVVALSITAAILPHWTPSTWLLTAAALLLILAVILSVRTVARAAVRFVYFVDTLHLKNYPGIRHVRRWLDRKGIKYEHNPADIPAELTGEIETISKELGGSEFRRNMPAVSMAVAVTDQGQSNEILGKMAIAFLRSGLSIQYLTASRHPVEFVRYLKAEAERTGLNWGKVSHQVVVIDAYSSHFAFLDSWYGERTAEVESRLQVTSVRSSMTFAGMHSASAKAFHHIQKAMKSDRLRDPTLVIYEDTAALIDLESREQYRVFVRHVMPSERMWGGMFTIFAEANPNGEDWTLIQGYSSIVIDQRKTGEASAKTGTASKAAKT